MAKANVANTLVVPDATKVAPYYDDFDETKNFMRILFRPGYAVQARELTQLQTILQNQIERFGRHIFENGSSVIGGDIIVPQNTFATINLNPEYGSSNSQISASSFRNKTVILGNGDSNIKFQVIQTSEATDTDPPSLYGSYISNETFIDGVTIKASGEETYANVASSDSAASSKLAYIKDSIFFFNGYFIKVPAHAGVIGKYDPEPSVRVGLEFTDQIVTPDSDSTLLDPAQEAFNYQAPGATRYKAELNLSSRGLDSTDDSKFIELGRTAGGVLRSVVKFPIYSEIEEVMARRTYDESGNYTVRPFVITMNEDKYDPLTHVEAKLSPGKAYVYGYEYETIGDTTVRIPKAQTKRSVANFDLNMNYGNYVYVDQMKGVFDTSIMQTFDIHCVPYQFIDFSSNTNYQLTKIGTGRVRDVEFYSGDTDVNARKYEFYLFDTKFRGITSNANIVTANSITIYGNASANNNAYTGARLRITSGSGAGYSYDISYYDGATKNVMITTSFTETPTNASNVSIDFDFSDAESFVIHRSYTPTATSNANTNLTINSKVGGIPSGHAFITEPSLDTLVFSLPEPFIAPNIDNESYIYRKKYSGVAFTGGSTLSPISAGTNEDFQGATSSSNTSSTVMDNFLVICTDKGVSARSNGDVIKCTVTVSAGAPETATFATGNTDPNDTFVATVFAKMQFDPDIQPRLKSFVQANTKTLSAETPTMLTGSSTGSSANVYLSAGQVIISKPSRKVGERESLFISDVIGIDKIYDLDGAAIPASGTNLNDYNDVTNRFDFDNGQRDTHYDHASISLKPNYLACKGPLIVCCHYYTHTVTSGQGAFLSVDSYPDLSTIIYNEGTALGDGYSVIPTFKRNNGDIIELRDCIDFRPIRQNANNASPGYTLNAVLIPSPTTDFQMDYEYYLGRRDLIILNADKQIKLVQGIPSKNPQEPTIPSRSMVLYSLGIPPYTEYPANVTIKYIDNKRYTMRDIGKIDKRVENLEYYVTLNTLEKNALDTTITDVNGINRTKYGIFADTFTGHSLGNSQLDDYVCAMNFKEGWLQNEANTSGVTLAANVSLSSGIAVTRDKILIEYTDAQYLSQTWATKFAPIAEFLYATFEGNIMTLPEADIWYSTNVQPSIIITDTANNEYTTVRVFASTVNSQSRS